MIVNLRTTCDNLKNKSGVKRQTEKKKNFLLSTFRRLYIVVNIILLVVTFLRYLSTRFIVRM